MNDSELLKRAAGYLIQAVVGALVLLAVLVVLSGPSQRERQETSKNVRLLVEQSELNRELVCLAVLHNTANPAREDPRVVEICAEVGVTP